MNEPGSPFSVIIERTAQKQLQSIPKVDSAKILAKINGLRRGPLPRGCLKLSGLMSSFRIRSGDYRIIYHIDFEDRMIKIRNIGHRKDIYGQQ